MSQLYDAAGNPFLTDVLAQAQSLNALNATVVASLRGQTTAVVQVSTAGTMTLSYEGTVDGTNWFAVNMFPVAGGAPVTTSTTAVNLIGLVAGFFQFRIRVSAFTSGPATVNLNVAQGSNEQSVVVGNAQGIASSGVLGPLAQGAVTTAAPAYTNANMNPLSLTTAGALRTDLNSIIGTTAVAAAAGVQKVGISGNAGASVDAVAGAAAPANALYMAGRGTTVNPTSEVTGDAVPLMTDKAGRLVTTAGNIRELVAAQTTVITASTAETTIITAGGAGVFNDLSCLIITTTDVVAAVITIKDATAGTTRITLHVPATAAKDGPLVIPFPIPLSQAAANANWTATVSVNAGAVAISAVFVKNL